MALVREKHNNHIMAILFPVVLTVAGIVYYVLDPTIPNTWAPRCPVKMATGHNCPSCGIQRAFHCLLHGDFATALHYNYFLVISIPFLLVVIIASWYNFNHKLDWLNRIVCNRYVLISYVLLYFIWWILRILLDI